MIIDSLQNATAYASLHPLFSKAFEYLKQTDLSSLEDGKFEVADGIKAIVSDNNGKTAEASLAKFECHDKNIDIQVCIHGKETIGWKPRSACEIPNGHYLDEKDVRFFSDQPDTFFDLTDGQFVIFYPEDVHAPMIGDSEKKIKKLVLKIRI